MQTPENERQEQPNENADADERARKARLGRRALRAFGVVSLVAIGALTAVYAMRPDAEPLESASTLPAGTVLRGPATTAEGDAHPPAPAVVVLTQQIFPATHAVEYAGRRAELDGMTVTETVGERFIYVRPATLPNEVPLLVDVSGVRDLELDPAKVITVRGDIVLAEEAGDLSALSEKQRDRLDVARVYLRADEVVAPPES